MPKHHVVVFSKDNVRILTVQDPEPYKTMANAFVDPDLGLVRHLPPHFWKVKDGRIIPMDAKERARRFKMACDEPLHLNVDPERLYVKTVEWYYQAKYVGPFSAMVGALLGYLVSRL